MNIVEVLLLKFPQFNFIDDAVIQDDGQGPYIAKWNLEVPMPTQSELDAWAKELDLPYRQQQAVKLREYPSIGDQLDMIYRDKINDTNNWIELISSIKLAHPKPEK